MATTDDVYNLLKAVNEITLKRMETKDDSILNSLQQFELKRIEDDINAVASVVNNILVPNIQAIKTKVGA